MADKPVYTNEQIVAQLVRLGIWNAPQNPIAYAFLEQRPDYLPYESSFSPFSAEQRAAAHRAFALVAEVANLSFVQVADNGVEPGIGNQRITFRSLAVNQQYSGSADVYQYDGYSDIYGSDIILNTTGIAKRIENHGYFDWPFLVTIHEILHSIGLSHPGDYNGAGFTYEEAAEFQQDTRQYSIMSYWDAEKTGADHFIGDTQYVGSTPLLYDILALQTLYGANMSTRTGDTVYGFNSNTGSTPFNFSVNPAPVIAIWDAGGIDTLDFSGFTEASVIDLNEGQFSSGGGLTKNVAIAFGAVIENAVGGIGDDTLIGNSAANLLNGAAGADSMTGGGGDDIYIVDNAGDRAAEGSSGGGVDLVRSSISFTLPAGIEKLALVGTAAIDGVGNGLANVITGNAAANVLDGGAGADSMSGGGGDDIYFVDNAGDLALEGSSGSGTDLVRSSVSFALGAGVEKLVLGGTAAINGIGNGLANVISGNAAANLLDGRSGADSMIGGGGDDIYVVDNALDRASEGSSGSGVDVVRSLVSFTLGTGIENLVLLGLAATSGTGNALANSISGNSGANLLKGGGGTDTLMGGRGDDKIYGGSGNDVLKGGYGADGFYFDAELRGNNIDAILDFSRADDTIFLDRDIFKAIGASGMLNAAAFHVGSRAADAADRIIYDPSTGNIFYDADGTGAGGQLLFATVTAGTTLTHADFIAII